MSGHASLLYRSPRRVSPRAIFQPPRRMAHTWSSRVAISYQVPRATDHTDKLLLLRNDLQSAALPPRAAGTASGLSRFSTFEINSHTVIPRCPHSLRFKLV